MDEVGSGVCSQIELPSPVPSGLDGMLCESVDGTKLSSSCVDCKLVRWLSFT